MQYLILFNQLYHCYLLSCSPSAGGGESARLSAIYAQLEAMESDKAPARAAVILSGLGFTPYMQSMPTKWVDRHIWGDEEGRGGEGVIYAQLEAVESDKAPARAAVILSGLGFTPYMQSMSTKWVDRCKYWERFVFSRPIL